MRFWQTEWHLSRLIWTPRSLDSTNFDGFACAF